MSACLASSDVTTAVRRPVGYTFAARTAPLRRSEGTDGRTQAAEIQMEQTDIALANTLDTLRATGASAGGATALAQAALQSKKGIAASIESQEAQNEKLRAQGEQQLQQQKISEQQRLQGIEISEGQRIQNAVFNFV